MKKLTGSQKSAKAWEAKKQEYKAYKQTPEYKEMMNGLTMQVSIHSNCPNDPPYNPRSPHNYIYSFDEECNYLGKENKISKKAEAEAKKKK